MLSFEQILQRIESEIARISFSDSPRSLFEPIEYTLALGGKRIRPALTLMACNMYSDVIEEAVSPALGMEVFHNFTLLHDDLMDGADKRRNKPTVHKAWNTNAAILSGDAMLIVAYRLMAQTNAAQLKEVLDLFTQTALEICGGQQYDMEFEMRWNVSEAEYIEMIRLKTAVLLACCLKTGALIGGASLSDANRLYDFGIDIGLAFQLQDDLLDVYGETAVFGKNIGGDILCNKKTFLLINAFERASEGQRKEMTYWMGLADCLPADKIAVFTHIYNELRLKELTEKEMEGYYNNAREHIRAIQIEPARKTVLEDVCQKLLYRNS